MEKIYQYIMFDLDGTLVDSSIGITKAVQYALKFYNINILKLDELNCFIGPPLKDSFIKYYNFNEEDATLAVEKYREYYSTIGINESTLYDGIKETLNNLKTRNKKLIIATSKPEKFTKEILKNLGIIDYFDFISAATIDGTRSSKQDIIKYAIENINIKDISKCIMIGDTLYDIQGAKKNNIDSMLVSYGFATKAEIKEAEANYIVNSPKQIYEVIK